MATQAYDNDDVSPEQLRQKLQEYSTFIDKTLHPQLEQAVSAREKIETEIAEYNELQSKLTLFQKRPLSQPLESLVDLGHEIAYCHAVTNDFQTVYVHVGMGFHAELTLEEAVNFVKKRVKFLNTRLEDRVTKAKTVARHMEGAMQILEELGKEIKRLEGEKEGGIGVSL